MRGGRCPPPFWGKKMQVVKEKAYAKVNLTLEIVGQAEGYHMLDSFVASVDIFDVVTLKKRKDKNCTVRMRGMGSEVIPAEKNNALKAARMFVEKFGSAGVDVTIDKNIPMGAGLGGSSADIAGVLNGMAKLFEVEDEDGLDEIADALGSDSRYMRKGGFARMQGRGNKCYYLGADKPLYLLLLCPEASVSTKECFELCDRLDECSATGATSRAIDCYLAEDLEGLGKNLFNSMYPAAKRLCKEVEEGYETLKSFSPLGVTMTGSGSCVMALFESVEFCQYAKSRYKGDALCLIAKTV